VGRGWVPPPPPPIHGVTEYNTAYTSSREAEAEAERKDGVSGPPAFAPPPAADAAFTSR